MQKGSEIKSISNAKNSLFDTEHPIKAENESLRVTTKEMIAIPTNRPRFRLRGNASRNMYSTLAEEFFGVGIEMEYCSVNEASL